MKQPNEVQVAVDNISLVGDLYVPENQQGLILFAHGSGSSRHSPRNRLVAELLHQGGLATLLMDLLTEEEEQIDLRTREYRFDIDLLAERLVGTLDWLGTLSDTQRLPIGLFGSSTGAAAALIAAAQRPAAVRAVVSRGGRPDLAGAALPHVQAPTLLLVGGDDLPVIGLNRQSVGDMRAEVEMRIIPGASHLFEEQGALEQVARMAQEWFRTHL